MKLPRSTVMILLVCHLRAQIIDNFTNWWNLYWCKNQIIPIKGSLINSIIHFPCMFPFRYLIYINIVLFLLQNLIVKNVAIEFLYLKSYCCYSLVFMLIENWQCSMLYCNCMLVSHSPTLLLQLTSHPFILVYWFQTCRGQSNVKPVDFWITHLCW